MTITIHYLGGNSVCRKLWIYLFRYVVGFRTVTTKLFAKRFLLILNVVWCSVACGPWGEPYYSVRSTNNDTIRILIFIYSTLWYGRNVASLWCIDNGGTGDHGEICDLHMSSSYAEFLGDTCGNWNGNVWLASPTRNQFQRVTKMCGIASLCFSEWNIF